MEPPLKGDREYGVGVVPPAPARRGWEDGSHAERMGGSGSRLGDESDEV